MTNRGNNRNFKIVQGENRWFLVNCQQIVIAVCWNLESIVRVGYACSPANMNTIVLCFEIFIHILSVYLISSYPLLALGKDRMVTPMAVEQSWRIRVNLPVPNHDTVRTTHTILGIYIYPLPLDRGILTNVVKRGPYVSRVGIREGLGQPVPAVFHCALSWFPVVYQWIEYDLFIETNTMLSPSHPRYRSGMS